MSAPRCPNCGEGDRVVPVVYGLPAAALVKASERGEVQLGGCMEMPQQWYCGRCGIAVAHTMSRGDDSGHVGSAVR